VNWEDKCEEKAALVGRQFGRRMVADKWSMGEESPSQKGRVIWRELKT
jgi:hypothetical protein